MRDFYVALLAAALGASGARAVPADDAPAPPAAPAPSAAPAPPAAPAPAAPAPAAPAPAAPAAPAPAKAERLAVMPMRALGAKADAALALERTFLAEVARLPEVELVDRTALLKALRARPDCLGSLSCSAEAARTVGALRFVTGTVSELGELYTLDLKLLDTATGRELRRISHPVSGRRDALLEAVRAIAVELVVPARFAGSLYVEAVANDTPVEGAEVFVDGKPVGRTPLAEPVRGLRPGQHAVRVAKEGTKDQDLFVDVQFDKVAVARVDVVAGSLASLAFLQETAARRLIERRPPEAKGEPQPSMLVVVAKSEPRPPGWRIAGWSATGLGVVSVVTAIAFHSRAYATAGDLNRREEQGRLGVQDVPSYRDIDTNVSRARVLYAIGGTLVAAGVAALLYDRWLEQQPRPAPSASGWRATPVASAEGASVLLQRAF